MKKILGLAIAAVILIAISGVGSWAFFSDVENSTDNTLAAGTLDLNWNGTNDSGYKMFNLTNKAPGDNNDSSFSANSTVLHNAGTLTGELDISTGNVTNTSGSGGTEYEGGSGELGGVALMALFVDVDQSNSWTSGDIGLKNNSTLYYHPTALDYQTIDSYTNKIWNPGNAGVEQMLAGASDNFIVGWQIPTTAINNIQGDSVKITFYFTLEQPAKD
jgi:predicted ribosomally synthesized peptide with SipW-like signal peptide